ncbi:unnamed protein product [marine sediment metagenome]|uniref:Polysaccharide biosynthesis protein CapD-like domain-containing protein n=2 Tax=marine sediment metagenome TaxID=412755 RepID=X1R3D5_9ZZZZ
MGRRGQTFVLDMGQKVRITDIAEKLVKLSGLKLGKDITIDYTGLRSGEKLVEELWEDGEKLMPTRHEKIKRIRFQHRDHDSLDSAIEEMRKMVLRADRHGIMKKLCDLVPTYQFPGKGSRPTGKPSPPWVGEARHLSSIWGRRFGLPTLRKNWSNSRA